MEGKKRCVYCGKVITKKSKEHIIHNAIGGLYESEDICCPDCNNYLSKYIDVPFTKVFNPIIGNIKNLTKKNNKNAQPLCTGKAEYKGNIYDVKIKNGKVINCLELSKKLQCDVSKLSFKILGYDFSIENRSFKNGIAKIAFNFAMEKGICVDTLKKGLIVEKKDGKINDISFEYPVIPFVALNPIDKYIEIESKIEIYHNLILFNQDNQLWCYVDLFNTFQYYVLLSDEYDQNKDISETYLQLIQKIDRTTPKIEIRSLKDIDIYSRQYGVEPSMDEDVLEKRIKDVIQKESVKKDMVDVISSRIGSEYIMKISLSNFCNIDVHELEDWVGNLQLYFDEDDRLNENTFRRVIVYEGIFQSYPELISHLIYNKMIDIKSYTTKKFEKMNYFLINNN